MRHWLSIRTARSLWQQYHAHAWQIPHRIWALWITILFTGAVVITVLSVMAVWIVRPWVEAGPLQAWDEATLLWVAAITPMPFPQAMWAGMPGDLIMLVPVVMLTVIVAIRRGAPLTAATALTGYLQITGLLWVGWSIWNRARPDLIAGGIAAPGLHSFPSGHMVTAVPVYGLLCYLWCAHTCSWTERIAAILLTMGFLGAVGWARLVTGVHWPTDVIAGTLLGFVWLLFEIAALRRAAASQAAP